MKIFVVVGPGTERVRVISEVTVENTVEGGITEVLVTVMGSPDTVIMLICVTVLAGRVLVTTKVVMDTDVDVTGGGAGREVV